METERIRAIYKKELDHLRSQGRMIGEVGCLATHPEFRDGSQNILMHGNKIMLKYAMEYLKLDDLVITVNPKHALVYKEVLLFEEIGEGEIKAHPKVNGNPAVALRLNLHEVEAKCRHFYQNNPLEKNLHHFLLFSKNFYYTFSQPLPFHSQKLLDDILNHWLAHKIQYLNNLDTLYFVSDKMNTGRKPLQNLEKLESGKQFVQPVFSIGTGLQKLEYFSTIDRAKELISK